MGDPATYAPFPFFQRHDHNHNDAQKYSPSITSKTSNFGSDASPLAAHSSTTTASSSRLSGSYEPSQVSSAMDDYAQMSMPEPASSSSITHAHGGHSQSQRPHVPHIMVPSAMSMSMSPPPTQIHAPYTNYASYPNYYSVGSPVIRDHPSYPFSPVHATSDQAHGMHAPGSFSSAMMYNGSSMQTTPYTHHTMSRRPSVGVYYNYDYAANSGMQSPVSPYGFPQPPSSVIFLPPTQAQPYSPVTSSATRQTRPIQASPLRPLPSAAPSLHSGHPGSARRPPSNLYTANPSTGHPSSNLVDRSFRRDQRDPIAASKSALLADFKNNKSKRHELKDILGHCVEFSSDQHGSRFIQQKFDSATPEERQIIFDEIITAGHGLPLMRDVFGNYVIQKLFEYGSLTQKAILCSVLEGNVLQLSLDMYGCRVVQKSIDCISSQQQSSIVAELNGHILQCVKDANGNHVIQKLLERVIPERMTFIAAFTGNIYNLAAHPYGCRVLQRCFEYASQEQVAPLVEELHQNASALMQDPFGNYVIQFILEHGTVGDRNRLIDVLRGQLLIMSRHKSASNVCEKALVAADPTRRRLLFEEMLAPGSGGVIPVSIMMKDQYANYVLQKALSLVEGDLLDALVAVVRPQLISMRRHPTAFTKHLNSIERLLKERGFHFDNPSPLSATTPNSDGDVTTPTL